MVMRFLRLSACGPYSTAEQMPLGDTLPAVPVALQVILYSGSLGYWLACQSSWVF